jgi:hypothetical protein
LTGCILIIAYCDKTIEAEDEEEQEDCDEDED